MEYKNSSTEDNNRNRAALLLGPTGAGKTPLGRLIEQRGLWGVRCLHFDFGDNLREVVRRNRPDDSPERVSSKLAIFRERTTPLLQHYRPTGARVVTIETTPTMTPEQMWEAVERRRFAV
ncbi:MAG: hypothetical protein V3R99_02015 [Thermoguttaceae bacterium]